MDKHSPPQNLNVFHANNVTKILTHKIKFRYLESENNFADVLTKKFSTNFWLQPKKEKELDVFFNFWLGPKCFSVQFLHNLLKFPQKIDPSTYKYGTKKNAKVLVIIAKNVQTSILQLVISRKHINESYACCLLKNRYSNIIKFAGVLSLVVRFVAKICAKLTNKMTNKIELSCKGILLFNNILQYSDKNERGFALKMLIREEQQKHFPKEMSQLKAGKLIDSESCLKTYSPQLDDMGVLYAQTRLDNLDESLQDLIAKDPVILPSKSEITHKLIMYTHLNNKHSNLKSTLSHLRSEYLIFHPRKTVKTSLKECTLIQCRLPHLVPFQAKMSNLPKLKLRNPFGREAFNYRICSLDLFGPYLTTLYYKGQNFKCKKCKSVATNPESSLNETQIKIDKTWVLVLTCLYSKHISLEPLMGNHSTENFL